MAGPTGNDDVTSPSTRHAPRPMPQRTFIRKKNSILFDMGKIAIIIMNMTFSVTIVTICHMKGYAQ